jgi:hypothetical protein
MAVKGKAIVSFSLLASIVITALLPFVLHISLPALDNASKSPSTALHSKHLMLAQTTAAIIIREPKTLQIPFYVYDNELLWSSLTLDGIPIANTSYPTFKHSDDYWFLQSALRHPMRTMDPSKAKLFYVPTLLNAATEQPLGDQLVCLPKVLRCANPFQKDDFYWYADKLLAQSKWFQRSQGKDHILVASNFNARLYLRDKPHLQQSNIVIFENFVPKRPQTINNHTRIEIPSMYIGEPCIQNQNHQKNIKKEFDFGMIARLTPVDDSRFQTRRDICEWLAQGNYSTSICGLGKKCPALAQSKYSFHARGDSWGANRPIDIWLSGTVPIFTNPRQYQILPDFGGGIIPWREMSVLIDTTKTTTSSSPYQAFSKSLDNLLQQPQSVYDEKIQLIAKYRDMLDYTTHVPFDLYMSEFASRLGLT